ncbi:MAG TPA: FCD domain-containing protein [Caulobacteraceae bacterium]|nr:FCD domain-containing protein [Caulobacteraceae bacterium]
MTGVAPGENGSLVDQAVRAVNLHIQSRRLRVGDSVPGEGHFAASLGVSRGVIREAFGALAALKLIDVGNGRKPRVAAIDGSVIAASLDHAVNTAQITVPEVWDVRRTIELRTVALAAASRDDAEAACILGLAQAMATDADDRAAVTGHDIAFHVAIARAAHNALFLQIVTSFTPLMEVAVPTAWSTRTTPRQRRTIVDRHLAVARAIESRNVGAAIAAMDAHFDSAVRDLLTASSEPPPRS